MFLLFFFVIFLWSFSVEMALKAINIRWLEVKNHIYHRFYRQIYSYKEMKINELIPVLLARTINPSSLNKSVFSL